jgi:hypothetical protein
MAFASMRVGERAILTCTPEYAYGEVGSLPKIPPNTPLRFDAELLSFTPASKEVNLNPSPAPDLRVKVEQSRDLGEEL